MKSGFKSRFKISVIRGFLLSLVFCVSALANGRVETVRFQSKLVNTTLPYNVILPSDYDSSKTTRYPVLYLLHGLMGHYDDWVVRTNIADYAANYRIIVVMPEGNDSWYIDKYETYILQDLIPDVQQRYRTIEARYARAIAGLSMGGYGAIKFGLKSPGTFVFAGSMSGVFSVTRLTDQEIPESWRQSLKNFGASDSQTRTANDPLDILQKLTSVHVASLPYFYFDCGTEDLPLIFRSNRELAAVMSEKKIPHEFRELPGDHSWAYWDQQVQEVLKIAAEKMRLPRTRRISRA